MPVQLSPSIYRSSEAEAAVRALYARTRAALPFPTDERVVETRLGPTHLLTAGPEGGPRLVLLQGGNVVNPITLGWLAPLAERLRIIAPDTPGQPGLSHPHRPRDQAAYGGWVADVLDAVGWSRANIMGASQGAGVALRLAAQQPARIERLVLVVPSGIVGNPIGAMVRLTLGFAAYRLTRRRGAVESVARRLSGDRPPAADLVEAIALSFGGTTLETDMPPLVTSDELRDLTAPVLVLAGEHDPLFPPSRVLPRARALFPRLEAADVLRGSGHILDNVASAAMSRRVAAFLGLDQPGERAARSATSTAPG